MPHKVPESVLVVIHSPANEILLLERADHPGFWQSVTGSKDTPDENTALTAQRELFEETGIRAALPIQNALINAQSAQGAHSAQLAVAEPAQLPALIDLQHNIQYEIFEHWRWRYAPGVTHNTEHWFSVCVPRDVPVKLSEREHLGYQWLPWEEAAQRCFSWSNCDAIKWLMSGSAVGVAGG